METNLIITKWTAKTIDQMEYELNNALAKSEKQLWLRLLGITMQRFNVIYDNDGHLVIIDTVNKLKMLFDENLVSKVFEYD